MSIDRYSRQVLLPEIGSKGQALIAAAKVLVIGAGGLGCPVLQYLAGAGIGHLGIADMDTVSESNLHRQILFTQDDIGKNKAIAAAHRLKALNSHITITTYPEGLTAQNALSLFANYDLIVDGSDNFETRYLVNDACVQLQKPWIYGAIYKFEGQWAVFNYNHSATYRCLFPTAPKANSVPSCNQVGVLGVVPGFVGVMQANLVLNLILFPEKVTGGSVYYFNSQTMAIDTVNIKLNPDQVIASKKIDIETYNYGHFCGVHSEVQYLDLKQALTLTHATFIDVRNHDELPRLKSLPVKVIPLNTLKTAADLLQKQHTYVLFCQSGIRSAKAAHLLNLEGFKKVYSLNQGAEQLAEAITLNKINI